MLSHSGMLSRRVDGSFQPMEYFAFETTFKNPTKLQFASFYITDCLLAGSFTFSQWQIYHRDIA